MQLRTRHREPGPSDGVDTTVQAAQRRRAALDARYDVACAPAAEVPVVVPLPVAAAALSVPTPIPVPSGARRAAPAAASGSPMYTLPAGTIITTGPGSTGGAFAASPGPRRPASARPPPVTARAAVGLVLPLPVARASHVEVEVELEVPSPAPLVPAAATSHFGGLGAPMALTLQVQVASA